VSSNRTAAGAAKPTVTRPYIVRNGSGEVIRIVVASHPSTVYRHVAEALFKVQAASSTEVMLAMKDGIVPELIGREQLHLPE
jgi:hypothetical protein